MVLDFTSRRTPLFSPHEKRVTFFFFEKIYWSCTFTSSNSIIRLCKSIVKRTKMPFFQKFWISCCFHLLGANCYFWVWHWERFLNLEIISRVDLRHFANFSKQQSDALIVDTHMRTIIYVCDHSRLPKRVSLCWFNDWGW